MSQLDWFRNFVAVYRAGSVSRAAQQRHVSQPSVSQQLAALEAWMGVPLFIRQARGVVPTARAEALYVEIFDALDRLEDAGREARGRRAAKPPRFRLGASAEYFHAVVLDRLHGWDTELAVSFGDDRTLLSRLESGELDAAISAVRPASRALQFQVISPRRFVLVGPPRMRVPPRVVTLADLGEWLNGQPWVSYSLELPLTRRFWQQHLGTRFRSRVAIAVPDLRSVLRAVEGGRGLSLLPEFLCGDSLAAGRVREVWPVRELFAAEHWMLCSRASDEMRDEVRHLGRALAVS